jgi:uncharacterized membrane protein
LDASEDESLYRAVQRTLVGGMIVSFGLMGLGLVGLALAGPGGADPTHVVPLEGLPAAVLSGNPAALLDLGVLALMFIPAVHLVVALISFVRRGETRYIAATSVVLALLALGAALAFRR